MESKIFEVLNDYSLARVDHIDSDAVKWGRSDGETRHYNKYDELIFVVFTPESDRYETVKDGDIY